MNDTERKAAIEAHIAEKGTTKELAPENREARPRGFGSLRDRNRWRAMCDRAKLRAGETKRWKEGKESVQVSGRGSPADDYRREDG